MRNQYYFFMFYWVAGGCLFPQVKRVQEIFIMFQEKHGHFCQPGPVEMHTR